MTLEPTVSVIVPTYNRVHLIGETLDSVIAQTYENWECIVVDDGSTDCTQELLEFYCRKDSRIRYYTRPNEKLEGANSSRNYGFGKSTGSYIIWFDSDDLMTPNHIQSKINAVEKSNADFVIAQTANFQHEKLLPPYKYEKKAYGIQASDFILLKIHWYTYDVLLKREIAKKITWNENMKSWQDYNYFCKMVLLTENGTYLDEVLTHRRLHLNSIQTAMTKDEKIFKQELLQNRLLTFEDIEELVDHGTKLELIYGMMNLCYELYILKSLPGEKKEVEKIVKRNLGGNSLLFFRLSMLSALLIRRGYFLLEKAKKR